MGLQSARDLRLQLRQVGYALRSIRLETKSLAEQQLRLRGS